MMGDPPSLGDSGRGAMLRRLAYQMPGTERRNVPVRRVREAMAAWLAIEPAELGDLEPQTLGRMAAAMRGAPIAAPVSTVAPAVATAAPGHVPERRDMAVRLTRDAVAMRIGVHPSALGTLDPDTVSRLAGRFGVQRVRIETL